MNDDQGNPVQQLINMNRVARYHPFQGMQVLNDKGIRKALEKGSIRIKPQLRQEQFQPNTLDVRIGKVLLYEPKGIIIPGESDISVIIDPDDIKPTKVFPDKADKPIVIPPYNFAEIYFHENIEFDPDKYYLDIELRSSRGRNGLRLINGNIERDENGDMFVGVNNLNVNSVRLYGRDRFAQLFFMGNSQDIEADGHVVQNENEARELCDLISDEKLDLHGIFVKLKVGDRILKYKKRGTIDSRKKYRESSLFEIYNNEDVKINVGDVVIVQLAPELHLPDNIGLRLLNTIPYTQKTNLIGPDTSMLFLEHQSVNAGWVDSGYEGFVTAHPRVTKFDGMLKRGDDVCFGLLYKYKNSVNTKYGSSKLKSNYQGSSNIH
jgi:deoxycytidine triphosphate deaminase